MIKTYFRIYNYAVTSTPKSVIYFGGWENGGATDRVFEYQNLKWTLLGNLASPRHGHRSIKMYSKIYIFGGNIKKSFTELFTQDGYDTSDLFLLDQMYSTISLSYIEIWENNGNSTNPNYKGTILDDSGDHQFDNDLNLIGEIIRINHDRCSTSAGPTSGRPTSGRPTPGRPTPAPLP